MALHMPTFLKRTGSAIIFAAIMLIGLLWDNPWAFISLVCIINVLCLHEFFGLLQKIDPDKYWPVWLRVFIQLIGLFIILVFSIFEGGALKSILWAGFKLLPLVVPALLLACTLAKRNSLSALLQSAGGLFYITMPMVFLANMHAHDIILPIAMIVMIWVNDTMAYIVGSFIGKTPFSPISPKKTWEGTAGGALLAIIAAGIYGHLPMLYTIRDSKLIDWVMIALCVAVAGTLGDLLESKLKRMADVKDSGNIMPGHGGALDRFDSLLIATPVVYVYYSLFM